MCTCMGYRNPAYLAKVAATIDVISGGRVEMGIGGGWYEHEWRAYGYGFPRAGERLGHARRGRADHARSSGPTGTRHPRRQALPGRRRHLPAAAAAGRRHPAVDRRRRREEDAADRGQVRAVHQLRRHARDVPRTSPRSSPRTAATSAPTSTPSSARPTTTSSSARPRRTCRTGWPGSASHYAAAARRRTRSTRRTDAVRQRPARRHARADRREAARGRRTSA